MINRKQDGAVLIVALMMLLVLTILGVASIRTSNTNLQLVDSQMRALEVEQVARNVTEYLLSDRDIYIDVPNVFVNGSGEFIGVIPASYMQDSFGNALAVVVDNIRCIEERPESGWPVGFPNTPQINYWNIDVEVTDSVSGASTKYSQGFKFKYSANNCK